MENLSLCSQGRTKLYSWAAERNSSLSHPQGKGGGLSSTSWKGIFPHISISSPLLPHLFICSIFYLYHHGSCIFIFYFRLQSNTVLFIYYLFCYSNCYRFGLWELFHFGSLCPCEMPRSFCTLNTSLPQELQDAPGSLYVFTAMALDLNWIFNFFKIIC